MAIALDANMGTFTQNTGSATIALTTTAAAVAGSTVFVAVQHKDGATVFNLKSVSDNGSPVLPWQIDYATPANGVNRVSWASAYAPAGLASGKIITATISGVPNNTGGICAASFTGIGPAIADALHTSTAGGVAAWTDSITTTVADTLTLTACELDSSTTCSSVSSSGTEIHDFWGTGRNRALVTHYTVATTTGTTTHSGTWSGQTGASEQTIASVAYRTFLGDIQHPFAPVPFMR